MLKQNPIAAHALLGKAGLVAACAAAALLLPLTPTVARQQDAQDLKQQEDKSVQKVEQQSKDEVIDAAPVAPHVVTVTSDVRPEVAVTPSVAPVAVEVTSTRDIAVAPTQVRTESDPIFTFADGQSSDLAVAGDPNSIDDPFRGSDSRLDGDKVERGQKVQQDRAARDLARAQAEVERLNKRLDDAKERLAKAQAQLMRTMPMANGKGGYLIAPPAANGQFNPKSMWSAPGASYFPGFGRPMAQGAQPGAGVGQAGGPGGGFRGGFGGGYVQSDDRDRRMDRLERQLEQLMKEVQALRTENSNNNENDSNNWNTPNPGMRK